MNAQIRVEKEARVESEIGNGVPANKLIHSNSFRRRTITTYLFFNCKGVRNALEKGLVKNVEEYLHRFVLNKTENINELLSKEPNELIKIIESRNQQLNVQNVELRDKSNVLLLTSQLMARVNPKMNTVCHLLSRV